MGLIRLFLAMSVVLGHAPGWLKTTQAFGCLEPYYAVQAFFVISGFYVSLIINEKYQYTQNWIKTFYINRYLRLFPSYFIVLVCTVILILIFKNVESYPGKFIRGDINLFGNDIVENLKVIYMLFTNLFILGQDLPNFFVTHGYEAHNFLLITPGWSLGAELWFYIFSPFLVRASNRWLITICLISFAVRYMIHTTDLPFFPWQQRLVACEVMFFIFGMLAHRFYSWSKLKELAQPDYYKYIILLLCSCLIVFNKDIFPSLDNNIKDVNYLGSLSVGLATMLTIPYVFASFRRSKIDRFIGELSYPVYLWHITLGQFIEPAQYYWHGFLLFILCIICSIPLIVFVEKPMEKFRGKILRNKMPAQENLQPAFSSISYGGRDMVFKIPLA